MTARRWSGKIPKTPRERFADLVDRSLALAPDACHPWKGGRTTNDPPYGMFQGHVAHRLAYQWWVGPIPEGYQVDHICRLKLCVRPEHLEAVTQAENVRRVHRRGPPPIRHDVTDDLTLFPRERTPDD